MSKTGLLCGHQKDVMRHFEASNAPRMPHVPQVGHP